MAKNPSLGGQRTGNRPRAKQLQPLYDPQQTLRGSSLKSAARSLTNLEIRPQVSALARQIAQTNRQGQAAQAQTAGYFTQLGDQAKAALEAQQGVTTRLNDTLRGIGENTQQQLATAGQQAQASLAPAQAKGLDGGGFDRLAQEIVAQQMLATQNADAAKALGATQGANYEGLSTSQAGTQALRGQERLSELANAFTLATAEPRAKKAELLASRGALMSKNLGALRDSERNYGLALQTLGLDAQKAAADAANDRARLRQSERHFNIQEARQERQFQLDVDKFGADVAKDRYQRRHHIGSYATGEASRPALTRDQTNHAYEQIDTAKSVISQLLGQKDEETGKPITTKDIRQLLTTGSGDWPKIEGGAYGPFVNAAMDLVVNGRLSRANVKALHQYGLQIGGRYDYERKGKSHPDKFREALGLG